MSATNRGKRKRDSQDNYQTPVWVIETLLNNYQFCPQNTFLEPCVGRGNIFFAVQERFPNLKNYVGIEINNSFLDACEKTLSKSPDYYKQFAERTIWRNDNFLFYDSETWDDNFHYQISPPDLIITNPPYKLMNDGEFLRIALKHLVDGGECAFLLRINWLGAQKRYNLMQQLPFKKMLVLSRRPSFTKKGNDATEYAWIIFQKGFQGDPTFRIVK